MIHVNSGLKHNCNISTMLLLGPEGGNLEVGSSELVFRGKDGAILQIPFDQILAVKVIDGYRMEVCFADFKEDILKVKRICQAAIDVAMLQRVHAAIQVRYDHLSHHRYHHYQHHHYHDHHHHHHHLLCVPFKPLLVRFSPYLPPALRRRPILTKYIELAYFNWPLLLVACYCSLLQYRVFQWIVFMRLCVYAFMRPFVCSLWRFLLIGLLEALQDFP